MRHQHRSIFFFFLERTKKTLRTWLHMSTACWFLSTNLQSHRNFPKNRWTSSELSLFLSVFFFVSFFFFACPFRPKEWLSPSAFRRVLNSSSHEQCSLRGKERKKERGIPKANFNSLRLHGNVRWRRLLLRWKQSSVCIPLTVCTVSMHILTDRHFSKRKKNHFCYDQIQWNSRTSGSSLLSARILANWYCFRIRLALFSNCAS